MPIPVYAEMGSVNPIVVTEGALRARGREDRRGPRPRRSSNFGGQLCTKPGVVFVPAGEEGDAFAADLAARLDGVPPSVLLNERLRDALRSAVDRLAARPEVRPLGDAPAADGPGFRHQPAAYEAPAAAVATAPRSCWRSTSARSCCCCATARSEELLAALAQLDGQLTGSVHAEPGEDVADVVEALGERAGRVVFNGFPTGVAVTTACTTAARSRRPRARCTRPSA